MDSCKTRLELEKAAENILKRIIETNQKQIDALRQNNQAMLMRWDHELELLVGEKERAFGALRQHMTDHKC